MSMKVSLNQFDFHRLNLNNRLVDCQKLLLIKRKIFNTLGNLTLIHLLNAKWKEMELKLPKVPLLHKFCSSQKSCRVFDTKSRFSRILIFFAILFFFARSTKHRTYRLFFHRVVTGITNENHSLRAEKNNKWLIYFSFFPLAQKSCEIKLQLFIFITTR